MEENRIVMITKNSHWDSANPFITVVTPVFNRIDILPRAIRSIEEQTFRDFEYIIINDGSTQNLDEVVVPFMNQTDIPVMYIKKENGGVHTARNAGVREARGFLITWLDSDDEFMPETLDVIKKAWDQIPSDKADEYFQISSRCMDENGQAGTEFPDNINTLEMKEAYAVYNKHKVENLLANRADIMKANPWPEPEDITFVGEDVIWLELEQKYRTWFINDILRVYHTEGTDHVFSSSKKKDLQYIKNCLWTLSYHLNHWKGGKFFDSFFKYELFMLIYRRSASGQVREDFLLRNPLYSVLMVVLFIPALFGSWIYESKKMK